MKVTEIGVKLCCLYVVCPQCFHNAVILKSGSNTGNWDGYDVANVANRIMLEVKPNIKNVGENPLQGIYNNNLPGMLKDIVYYTSVYGIPMNCALDMNIIYKACKQLDEHGWLEK